MALTKHHPGSFRELWHIALPLMISSLSVMVMIFVDRYMLAQFSAAAHNAAVNATTFGWSFIYSAMVLTSITEVFVAQYNGAGLKEKMGEPVWQMIWLSAATILIFIPIGICGVSFFNNNSSRVELEIAKEYFKWTMYFGPTFALYGALCGFFIGQGKAYIITILAVCANILNVILDYSLIFGIEGLVPSLGPKGAAIATNSSTIFQDIVLFGLFLSPQNRKVFKTGNWHIYPTTLLKCLKVGLPNAIFVGLEILGFAAYYGMMTWVGESYITVAGICQNVAILLFFFPDGINKAATTVAGNMIGAEKRDLVKKVLVQGTKMQVLFLAGSLMLLFIWTESLVRHFLPHLPEEKLAELYPSLQAGLICIIFYIFFDGLRLLLAGILTAAGDTVFLFYAGGLSVWIFLVVPIYAFIVHAGAPVEVATLLCVFYSFIATLIYYYRFKKGAWKTIQLTTNTFAKPLDK